MKITELKKKFKNKWVLVEVLKEDQYNRVLEAKPVLDSNDRAEVYAAFSRMKGKKHLATIYTGKLPPKGMVYAFDAKLKI